MSTLINEMGNRYGRLLVTGEAGRNKYGVALWKCICDCGTRKIIDGRKLRSGSTKSCGCLQRESLHKIQCDRTLPRGQAAFNHVCRQYERRAKRRGYSWELTKEDVSFLTQMNCHYCGCEPTQISTLPGFNGTYVYNGIDRIDNKKGYTLDNVVPCCGLCNGMKRALGYKEFLEHISRIMAHRSL